MTPIHQRKVRSTMKWRGTRICVFLSAALLLCSSTFMLRAQQPIAEGIVAGQPQPRQIKTFQALEDQWSTDLVNGDQYGMELLLSPYFVDISASGQVDTRDQFIAFMFARAASRPYSMEQKVASVRIFGDMAIVSGTYQSKIVVDGVPR